MAPWYFVFGILFIVVFLLGLSWYMRRFISNLADYYVMGRKAPWWLFTCTTTATWLSMWTLMGGAGLVTQWGPWAIQNWFMGSVAGLLFFCLILGPAFRRGKFLTVPDFFEERFGSKRVRAAAVLALIVALYFYIVLQVTGGTIIFEQILGIPYLYAMILFLALLVVCLFFSGMWSVVVTDAFGFVMFMVAGLIFPIVVIRMAGGLEAALAGAGAIQGAEYWTFLGKSGVKPMGCLGNILSWIIILGASPHLINRAFVVRETKDIYKGGIGTLISGTALTFLLYLGCVGLVNLMDVGKIPADWVMVKACLYVVPPALGVLYLMGAFTAGVTTANTQLITCAQGIARDLWQKLIKPEASDQTVIRYTYVALGVIAIASAVVAAIKPWLLVYVGTITGMILAFGYFPALVLGLFWEKLTGKAVEYTLWLSVPVGIFVVYTWTKYNWFQPHPTIWGAIFGFGMVIVLSYLTKKTPQEIEAWERLRGIMWPDKPTLRIDKSDYKFMIGAFIVSTILGILIIGLYVGWFW